MMTIADALHEARANQAALPPYPNRLFATLSEVYEAVVNLEETEGPIWHHLMGFDDINDAVGELHNLLSDYSEASQFARRDKALEIMVACARYIRDCCGDK